jgi:hypothetical protein
MTAQREWPMKLEAVKLYKEQMGISLMQAKTAVDGMQWAKSIPSRGTVDANVEAEIVRLLSRGEKLDAVKLYRKQGHQPGFCDFVDLSRRCYRTSAQPGPSRSMLSQDVLGGERRHGRRLALFARLC